MTINADSSVQILAEEAYPLDQFDIAVRLLLLLLLLLLCLSPGSKERFGTGYPAVELSSN